MMDPHEYELFPTDLAPGYIIDNDDCFNVLPHIPDKSVDLIICDPPYGTTDCSWDKRLPLDRLFKAFRRVIKDHGAIVAFAQAPYSADIINAWRSGFRYEIVWDKINPTGWLNANRMPMRRHELMLVFYRHLPTYNPQMTPGGTPRIHDRRGEQNVSDVYRCKQRSVTVNTGWNYPVDILPIRSRTNRALHPTEKPPEVMEWLVRTYTNPGDLVLDPCCGSGNSGVASFRLGRKYIGIEKDAGYYNATKERLMAAEEGDKNAGT